MRIKAEKFCQPSENLETFGWRVWRCTVWCVLCESVCVTAGYLASYWNRPFFPDWCSDATLDNSATYDTMVRIAGSWAGVSHAFKTIADHYNWTDWPLRLDAHRSGVRQRRLDAVLVRIAAFRRTVRLRREVHVRVAAIQFASDRPTARRYSASNTTTHKRFVEARTSLDFFGLCCVDIVTTVSIF